MNITDFYKKYQNKYISHPAFKELSKMRVNLIRDNQLYANLKYRPESTYNDMDGWVNFDQMLSKFNVERFYIIDEPTGKCVCSGHTLFTRGCTCGNARIELEASGVKCETPENFSFYGGLR